MSRGKKRKKTAGEKLWRFFKVQMVLILIVIAGVGYYFVGGYAAKVSAMKNEAKTMVTHSTPDTFRQTQTSIVYDCNGEVLSYLRGEKDVYYLEYQDIPALVTSAIVSIEDKKFYTHNGVDYKAIVRAVIAMLENGEATQGASTISQQLARNTFLTQDKTWERKIEEMYVAAALEEKYTKQQILEFYLNNIYFANGYYGIQAAAKGYFNKTADQLNLSQICFLLAIPNSPSYYDPVVNPENTIVRRDKILKNMLEDKIISQQAYDDAVNAKMVLDRPDEIKHDYAETFTYYCATKALMEASGFEFKKDFKKESEEQAYELAYNEAYSTWNSALFTGGYRIYVSLDLSMQRELQKVIDEQLAEFEDVGEDGIYELQSAAVCVDNETGLVKAAVGGRSQDVSGYTLNRAYQSYRQPGSSIKPLIVYTPILERGYDPDTIVMDEPIEDGPSNANGAYSGEISLRTAVMYSKNTIAWKLFEELTPGIGLQYLKDMGFSKIVDADYGQASALGGLTIGVSPLEMAKGYATIENDGYMRDAGCIEKITDIEGNIIYEAEQEEIQIYEENAARFMTNMLQSVITDGTARGISLGDMPAGGKTGTTNSNRDGWFCGYTPYYTTSVWVGYDKPKEVPGLTGASYPAKIWQDFMLAIHDGLSVKEFKAPVVFEGTDDEEEYEGEVSEDELEPEDGWWPMTITQTFEGDSVPEGAIPEGATDVQIITHYGE